MLVGKESLFHIAVPSSVSVFNPSKLPGHQEKDVLAQLVGFKITPPPLAPGPEIPLSMLPLLALGF